MTDADAAFDDGPTGQRTHSQPWVIALSFPPFAAVQVFSELSPAEMRELATQLTAAADHLDNDGYETKIVRLQSGYGVMPVKMDSSEGFSVSATTTRPVMT